MKKLILKTVFITIGVVFILAASVFGIVSLCAPRAMMQLTASLGLDGMSGDYAYEEYERSGDIGCLARSFLISADLGNDRAASTRFDLLISNEGFEAFCEEENAKIAPHESVASYTYRNYVMGQGACVRYRLAATDEEKEAVVAFAVGETEESFPDGNPAMALAVEGARAKDAVLCKALRAELLARGFEETAAESGSYRDIVGILENIIKEQTSQ